MKRFYSNQNKNKNKKKSQLRRAVLAQLAKMRKKMKKEHPETFEKIRKVLQNNKQNKVPETKPLTHPQELAIDQRKNVEAVEKMLDLKGHSPAFQKTVKSMLAQQKKQ